MASYTIDNIKFSEVNDYEFRVSYLYNGIPLETGNMSRSIKAVDVAKNIENQIELYLQKRSDDNYQSLKALYDGKSGVSIPDTV